jgi:hypothetical protein
MQGKDAMAQAPRLRADSCEGIYPLDLEMVELMLLLPSGPATALEQVARQQNLTVAQILRQLIKGFLGYQAQALTGPLPFLEPEGSEPGRGIGT